MTITAMIRKKNVVLGLAMCLFLSSFHQASCQAEGSHQDEMERLMKMDFDKQGRPDEAFGESKDFFPKAPETLEEREERIKGTQFARGESTKEESKVETSESQFRAASMESESYQHYDSNSYSSSGLMGSLGIGQSGAWRCSIPNQNGSKEEDSIVIPKYDLEAIIQEESGYMGMSSKISSSITSLHKIIEEHRKGMLSQNIQFGMVTSSSSSATKETKETIEKLKVSLRQYQGIKISELVKRSEFKEILTMVARYEELTKAKVTYVSKLERYAAVIKEGFRATQQVQTMTQHVETHKRKAFEWKKRVQSEYTTVEALAAKGDALRVKIYGMKKLVQQLEVELEEIDMEFKKGVKKISRVLEESKKVYETYHVVHQEWTSHQASVEYSSETILQAETVWTQFLSTLN